MNPTLARLLTRIYPREWRERYGEEFAVLLESGGGGPGATVNVICAAFREHIFPTRGRHPKHNAGGNAGGIMDQHPSFGSVVRRPTAFLPLAMSLTALAVVLIHIAIYGAAREADEGAAAHIWQLLMAGQLPVLAFFAIKWLPRTPRHTLCVLGLQAGAALASLAPVFFFNL